MAQPSNAAAAKAVVPAVGGLLGVLARASATIGGFLGVSPQAVSSTLT
jgi:hypothetical protein